MGAAAADAETTEADEVEVVVTVEAEQRPLSQTTPTNLVIKGPNTLIYRQGSGQGALCTINSGEELIFVLNQLLARGKMSLRHAHNETGASPTKNQLTLTHQKLLCQILFKARKYKKSVL